MKGRSEIDNAYAFCNWSKQEGKGYFAANSPGDEAEIASAIDLFTKRPKNLTSVPVFAETYRRGRHYDRSALDAIVANFHANKATFPVPAVLGHDEEQLLLKGSGLPAAAWCDNVYRKGGTLYADFSGVPPEVARLLRARAYRRVSAEIYDTPPEGCSGKGHLLRRVAFLGGDVPELKNLGDIPLPEGFSEGFAPCRVRPQFVRAAQGGAYACFSEVEPVNREQMLQCLAEAGMDLSQVTDAVTDGLLAEMVRLLDSKTEEAEDATASSVAAVKDSEETAQTQNGSVGGPADERGDDERRNDEASLRPQRYEELDVTAEQVETLVAEAVARALEGKAKGFSDQVNAQQARLERFAEDQKKAAIEAFLDAKVKEGKLTPAQLDPADPCSVRARLYRADGKAVVLTFAEKGQDVPLTELDLQMREIDKNPAFRFGERFRQPAKARGEGDGEAQKIEAHFEQFAEQFGRQNVSKDSLVSGFEAARKRRPQLTADQYLNP